MLPTCALHTLCLTERLLLPLPLASPLQLGCSAIAQVLPTCALRTLALNTNSVGDDGAETLAKALSGGRPLEKCGEV